MAHMCHLHLQEAILGVTYCKCVKNHEYGRLRPFHICFIKKESISMVCVAS